MSQNVKDHYDRHSTRGPVTNVTESRRIARQKGGASQPLKDFHNLIKRKLITHFAGNKNKLLDLACGRGGDIWKWSENNIRFVKGIDLSPHEVEEAQSRAQGIKTKQASQRKFTSDCKFEQSDYLGVRVWTDPDGPYDVVTCMFALHFFFKTEQMCRNFFEFVSRNLTPGGYFVGCCPEGKAVLSLLAGQRKFTSQSLELIASDSTRRPECFGWGYTMAISRTVTAPSAEGTTHPEEYLVFNSAMKAIAARYGLEPVTDYRLNGREDVFAPNDRKNGFKHFHPPAYEKLNGSHESLKQASALNAAFVFRKKTNFQAPERKSSSSSNRAPQTQRQRAPSLSSSSSSVPAQQRSVPPQQDRSSTSSSNPSNNPNNPKIRPRDEAQSFSNSPNKPSNHTSNHHPSNAEDSEVKQDTHPSSSVAATVASQSDRGHAPTTAPPAKKPRLAE